MKLGWLKNKWLIFLLWAWAFWAWPTAPAKAAASATPLLASQPIAVTPTVIDQSGQRRDIFKYKIKIKNNSSRKVSLYAFVFNVYPQSGEMKLEEDSAHIDRRVSLVSWIKFKRSVIELMPGAETEVPLEINISPLAQPGTYYGKIILAPGSNRPLAKEKALSSRQPTIDLRLAVQEAVVEQAELEKFAAEKTIFFQAPIKFFFKIKNIGNRPITPTGGVRIYNRRGQEVETLYIKKAEIAAGNSQAYALVWSPKHIFGRYHARLIIDYGDVYQRGLQDALYFWVLPWPFLLAFAGGLIIVLILLLAVVIRHNQPAAPKPTQTDGVINLRQK